MHADEFPNRIVSDSELEGNRIGCRKDWVAHASRVLAMASRHRELFIESQSQGKAGFGETPKPTRETRALPGVACAKFVSRLQFQFFQ
jgi:hypothetical protein